MISLEGGTKKKSPKKAAPPKKSPLQPSFPFPLFPLRSKEGKKAASPGFKLPFFHVSPFISQPPRPEQEVGGGRLGPTTAGAKRRVPWPRHHVASRWQFWARSSRGCVNLPKARAASRAPAAWQGTGGAMGWLLHPGLGGLGRGGTMLARGCWETGSITSLSSEVWGFLGLLQ